MDRRVLCPMAGRQHTGSLVIGMKGPTDNVFDRAEAASSSGFGHSRRPRPVNTSIKRTRGLVGENEQYCWPRRQKETSLLKVLLKGKVSWRGSNEGNASVTHSQEEARLTGAFNGPACQLFIIPSPTAGR